ncbi:D-2-hydroxyacid dehydrogenase [Robertmurraya korlensis]|uniref:D-2-hydroxyacid dehydrogenase n=1 Tax=Robertmurraya korlensis TaxID=519977 RepID=UPI00203ED357|nr:D-2-hydroxyacid dehydrogenase [Robertmurraya korlensis]MCM3601339.1 D-2-hydroxyacid dehydrogenase [Robertmurraya korlensis]
MNIHNILIAGEYQKEFEAYFPNMNQKEFRFLPVESITEHDLDWADAYVGFKPCANFQLSKIKWVHSFNAGVNNYLDIEGWKENHVLLTRTICSFGERISEYCLSYILKNLQYHRQFQQQQQNKKWDQRTPKLLKDVSIIIFGTGAIGQEVAKTFTHFGSTVNGVSESGKQKEYFHKIVPINSVSSIIEDTDWIISTLPLTQQTKQLFNNEIFSQMKSVGFINVGRGATVDENALITALDSGNIHTAILDVVEIEPLPEDSILWLRKDVIITPHISAVTELNEAILGFAQTLHAIESNHPLPNEVDFDKGY